jgi:hypothetical protein
MTLLALAVLVAFADLRPVAGSHVTGDARFSQSAGTLVVTIELNGMFIPETQYPASVRAGRCADAGAALTATLRPVQVGNSRTVLAATSAPDILATPHSVRIMDASGQRVVWCGEIVAPGAKHKS